MKANPNVGSFEYYKNFGERNPFFKHLTSAIMQADLDNIEKLSKVFPHIIEAYRVSRWDVAPVSRNRLVQNEIIFVSFGLLNADFDFPQGSFGRYLMSGGGFFQNLARAMAHAERKNREKMGQEYPQLLRAYDVRWDRVPEGD